MRDPFLARMLALQAEPQPDVNDPAPASMARATLRASARSIRVGFEMRRDVPKAFGGGIWFSDVAVQELLKSLRTFDLPALKPDQEEYLRRIAEQTGKYDPDVMVGGPNKPPYNSR